MLWHTRNENDIIKYLKARKRGSGADAIDQSGTPFEVRESRKVPKFRIQKDVHEYLLQHDGYYIFKRGHFLVKVPASIVTKLLKKGKWNQDRGYDYKFLDFKKLLITPTG